MSAKQFATKLGKQFVKNHLLPKVVNNSISAFHNTRRTKGIKKYKENHPNNTVQSIPINASFARTQRNMRNHTAQHIKKSPIMFRPINIPSHSPSPFQIASRSRSPSPAVSSFYFRPIYDLTPTHSTSSSPVSSQSSFDSNFYQSSLRSQSSSPLSSQPNSFETISQTTSPFVFHTSQNVNTLSQTNLGGRRKTHRKKTRNNMRKCNTIKR